jgi:hypothetical protein
MLKAWTAYKSGSEDDKHARILNATEELTKCEAQDWRLAGVEWLMRRSREHAILKHRESTL